MSSAMMKVLNGAMRGILSSPLHGLVAKSGLLSSFKGRKSGKLIITPVSYSRDGNEVVIFTHGPWWKNFAGGGLVSLRIQGQDYQGFADPCDNDEQAKSEALYHHLAALPGDAKIYPVTLKDGQPDRKKVELAAKDTVMIRVKLKPESK